MAHHDDRRLDAGNAGQHQVQRDIGIGVEWAPADDVLEQDGVDHYPDHDHPEEDEDERPRASETGDVVGDALSERASGSLSLMRSMLASTIRPPCHLVAARSSRASI